MTATKNMGDSVIIAEVLRRYFEYDQAISGVEVGVHRGGTSATILRTFPRLHLYMVDPWATYSEDDAYRLSGDGCARLTAEQQEANLAATIDAVRFAEERTMIFRGGVNVAPLINDRCHRLDFVFIDGDHTLHAVRRDLQTWGAMVGGNGIVAGHDYNHPRCQRGQWGVDRAVQEYAKLNNYRLNVKGSVWWVQK